MIPDLVHGDLFDQEVDVLVNPWNRNVLPWWLLLPQGVSGQLKKRAGLAPFRELARFGPIPLGEARLTTSGRLPHAALIHVAGINLLWFATERSVTHSVHSALRLAEQHGFTSIAFPLIGAGSGQRGAEWSLRTMLGAFADVESPLLARVVRYRSEKTRP